MALDRFGEIPINPDDDPGKAETDEEAASGTEDDVSPAQQAAPPAPVEKRLRPQPPQRTARRPPDRRSVSLFRILIWLLVPLLLIVVYGVGSYFLVPALVRGPLAGQLSAQFNRPVAVHRIIFSPFSLQLILNDITIGPVHGDLKGGNLLECSKLQCKLVLQRILQGKLLCSRVDLQDVLLTLRRDAASFNDLSDVLSLFSLQFGTEAVSVWPGWLELGELDISGGTVLFNDDITGRQYRLEQAALYLPPSDPVAKGKDRLPELSAVVGSSPVHFKAVQIADSAGNVETSFELQVREVLLSNYLDYLPQSDSRFQLVDGQADIDLRIVFPVAAETARRLLINGESTIIGVRIADANSQTVVAAPEVRLAFQFAPLAKQIRFTSITATEPEFFVTMPGIGEKETLGLTPAEAFRTLETTILSPAGIVIEKMQGMNGRLHISPPGSSKPAITWSDVTFTLNGFENTGLTELQKRIEAAPYVFRATDNFGDRVMKISAEGQIYPGSGLNGQVSVEQLDFKRYRNLLPQTLLQVEEGIGSMRFSYDITAAGKGPGKSVTSVHDGEMTLADYSLEGGEHNSLSGRQLVCRNLMADTSLRTITCDTLELHTSSIRSEAPLVSWKPSKNGSGGRKWQLLVNNMKIRDSKLHVPLFRKLCDGSEDLELEQLSLDIENIHADAADNNLTAAARIGPKGTCKVHGGVSLPGGNGNLLLTAQNIDMKLVNPCLASTLIPRITQGTLHVQGNISLPDGRFSGQMWVNDMAAGEQGGPQISWQLASSDQVQLSLSPVLLQLGEVMVRKPAVIPGLLGSEMVLRNFFHPGKPAFEQLAIDRIKLEDGRLSLPWPIMLPGFQPDLVDISGTLADLHKGSMPFAMHGRVQGVGPFTVQGTASADRVENYTLTLPDFSLGPFTDFFRKETGLSADSARGIWRQELIRNGDTSILQTNVRVRELYPVLQSPLLQVSSLLLDKDAALAMELKEEFPSAEDGPFLFLSMLRYMQHQAVRAEISQRLVLQEFLPDLSLPEQVPFAPGTDEASEPSVLSDYAALLDQRPYLRLVLQGSVDEVDDRSALQKRLQQEADRATDRENQRRALEKQKRAEMEKQRLEAIKEGKMVIESEKIDPAELTRDLEPLPRVQVSVTPDILRELAGTRVRSIYSYLVDQLFIDPGRVALGEETLSGQPGVHIRLEPVLTVQKTTGEVENDDT